MLAEHDAALLHWVQELLDKVAVFSDVNGNLVENGLAPLELILLLAER
jgi:hypothetical protein